MNEQLQQLLIKALEKGGDIATFVGNKLFEEAPELVREILAYKQYAAMLIGGFELILIGLLLYFGSHFNKQRKIFKKQKREEDEGTCIFAMTLLLLATIGTCIFFSCELLQIIKIHVAPRLYILEYITHLLNQRAVHQASIR